MICSIQDKTYLRRDALDTIRIYLNDSLISKWTEFDNPKTIDLKVNKIEDTLTFLCSTDVGWMDSSSLTLTTNLEVRSTLNLEPYIDSNSLKMHYKLPGRNIEPEVKNIQVWRNTSSTRKNIIFNINLIE